LYQAANYYYSSVWHEPVTGLEFLINQQDFDALPADLQSIVEVAANAVNESTLAEYNARNNTALKVLVEEYNVQLRQFPAEVMLALKHLTDELIAEQVKADKDFARVWQSYSDFLPSMREYNKLTLQAYYQNR
jgi:TRAP-type mannitol/chloroaromatic compound transport system substrate-binding protein